jgi:hypothetical protein
MARLPVALLAVACALGIAGCSGSGDESTATTSTSSKGSEPVEKAESVPDLPQGWNVVSDPAQGFRLGSPPGWPDGGDCLAKGTSPGETTVLCSPDKLVTLSITADRSADALTLSPPEFAVQTLEGLGAEGFRVSLDGADPKAFDARYRGAMLTAKGTASTGVRQEVTVVVMRRDGVATFVAVIAANADKPTEPAVKLATEALRTLRSQPLGAN